MPSITFTIEFFSYVSRTTNTTVWVGVGSRNEKGGLEQFLKFQVHVRKS